MAGKGRKVWTRETLSSAQLQDYLQDQVVMRFPSVAARNVEIPAPTEGMVCTLDDTNQVLRHDGSGWRPVSRIAGNRVSATSDANGLVAVAHGLGVVPKWALAVPSKQSTAALDSVIKLLVYDDAMTTTNFFVRTYRHDGANGTASPFTTAVVFHWVAGLD